MFDNLIPLRKNAIVVPKGQASDVELTVEKTRLIATMQAELMNMGYALSKKAWAKIEKAPGDWITSYLEEVIPYLKKMKGAIHQNRAFYVNFPKQVLEMSDLELYLNAIVHYWSNGTWEPEQAVIDRGFKFEKGGKFVVLEPATNEIYQDILIELCSMNTSLTSDDSALIVKLIKLDPSLKFPAVIPFKETLCLLAAQGFDVPISTPTDVLRIATYLSGGDISLPGIPTTKIAATKYSWQHNTMLATAILARERAKFNKFTRAQRKCILGLLEKSNCDPSEMKRYEGQWLRLGEILHPGEFSKMYPKAFGVFQALRNQNTKKGGEKVRSYAGRVDLAFKISFNLGIETLTERPGEYARRLDWLLRTHGKGDPTDIRFGHILNVFIGLADRVSSKVLFELFKHFSHRDDVTGRTVLLKSSAKMQSLETLEPMTPKVIFEIKKALRETLIAKAKKKGEKLGAVWIDPRLKEVPLPFGMRSSNSGLKSYIRGTRLLFHQTAKTIRAFVHWFDEDGSQDIDLSGAFYSENLVNMGHVSWTCLRNQEAKTAHSGDVRHRVGACAEYIDVDIQSALDFGARYVVVSAYNFNGGALHSVKDCVFGLMEREFPEANKHFVPATITNAIGINNNSNRVIPAILDLKERCMIWADLETSNGALPVIEVTGKANSMALDWLIGKPSFSVYDLLTVHAEARGKQVVNRAKADVSFVWEDLVSDYTKIGNLMALD